MLLEISGEITPEKMKGFKQSKLLLVWLIFLNVKNKIKHIIKLTKDKDPDALS